MPKKAPSVKDYLRNIDTASITTGLWDPAKQWNRWHGDGKSTTGGAYHIETMLDSNGVHKAKVVGPGGGTAVSAEWAAGSNPSVVDVVKSLKANA